MKEKTVKYRLGIESCCISPDPALRHPLYHGLPEVSPVGSGAPSLIPPGDLGVRRPAPVRYPGLGGSGGGGAEGGGWGRGHHRPMGGTSTPPAPGKPPPEAQ